MTRTFIDLKKLVKALKDEAAKNRR